MRAQFALGMTKALVSVGSRLAPFETGGFLVDAFTRTRRTVQRSVDLGESLSLADRFEIDHGGKRIRGFTVRPEGAHPNLDGDGPHVLLVHGWDGGAHQMLPFVRPLVEHGYVVSLFDLPAHGSSDGDHTTIREIADVIRAIGESQGPFAAVVAHSVGAAATTLAMLEGVSFERAVFVAPPISLESQARAFATSIGADDASLVPMLATIRGIVGRPIDGETWLRDVAAMTSEALVVHDRNDRIIPFASAERLAAHWPRARILATDGLGHARILRDPSVVGEVVRFIDERADRLAS